MSQEYYVKMVDVLYKIKKEIDIVSLGRALGWEIISLLKVHRMIATSLNQHPTVSLNSCRYTTRLILLLNSFCRQQ